MDLIDLYLKKYLIPSHPLTNFEIQKYYQNEPRFNGVYSKDNLHDKIKDGGYVINLDEYFNIRTHWIACMYEIIKSLTLIVLELNIFQMRLKNLLKDLLTNLQL